MNLIPLNPTPGYATLGTPPGAVAAFRDWLGGLGVNATVRANRGTDIAAACSFLCSEGGSYITGQIIGVNGGMYI